ncbi:beta-N-acetylhexosaminidase [Iodobacter sp. LRB]|uniref:beta-N-acetylhexosaminidase n=1 Tax=unclassified Iodobacter TaxID=235634 RepID=UPI000C0F78E3|nr:beta-N-acetylhexosaminidase [Iodobacter sp. BJB302]PHV00697.1 beta-N-acetylhexosaminidase [Iodobacter sp. BJB302]
MHAAELLHSLTLSQKVAQLFMVGFDGLMPNSHIEEMLRKHQLGGIILFRRNVETPGQLAALNLRLQQINLENSPVPLMIGTDQEGGMVMRIEAGVTPLPSAMAFKHAASEADCEALTRVGNAELKSLGININFAPVLDINNNPQNPVIGVRAYGETVSDVCQYGLAALRGIQSAGMAATGKHFPGHGDTAVDSHHSMPVVAHDRARLDAVELAPFSAAFDAGLDAVMTAHVAFPAIEPDLAKPATISHAVLTGLLRNELNYQGVVITDCLEMDAIGKGVGTVKGAVSAITAGADIVLISHTPAKQAAAFAEVLRAVKDGEISEARIDESVLRILALKQRYQMSDWASLVPSLLAPESLQLSERVHQAAISGEARQLDKNKAVLLISAEVRVHTEIDEVALGKTPEARNSLATPLRELAFTVSEEWIGLQPSAAELDVVLSRAAHAEQIIFVSYNAALSKEQRALIDALPHDKLWLIAGRLPYDLDLAPEAAGRLSCCSNRPAALSALAWKLAAADH